MEQRTLPVSQWMEWMSGFTKGIRSHQMWQHVNPVSLAKWPLNDVCTVTQDFKWEATPGIQTNTCQRGSHSIYNGADFTDVIGPSVNCIRIKWSLVLHSKRHSLSADVRYLLHFAWVVDDAKCIMVTRVCVSVCLSVHGRTPTVLHGPGCDLGAW